MGNCSSTLNDQSGFISNQEADPEHPEQAPSADSAMDESSGKTDFNCFMEATNTLVNMAKKQYDHCEELQRRYSELMTTNKQITADNNRLRKRIGNNSEMSHRGHQSSSEDGRSRNKRSEVLLKYKTMDGAIRRQAMEAFGKQPSADRAELWNRKELTCRIFLTSYKIAECAKEKFIQQALPRFFQCAPSVGIDFEQNSPEASKFSQQSIMEEMQSLLSTESFKVACSSVLKELAVSCDLTDLEKELIQQLKRCREQWKELYPLLPCLDDKILANSKMKNYIKECVRLSWRMVNLLPPLKIVTADEVLERKLELDDFFEKEVEGNKEKAQPMVVCVWPAVTDYDNPDEVLVKGTVAIIPRPKNLPYQI